MPRQKGSGNGSIYYDKDKNKWIVKHYKYDIVTNSEKQVKKAFSNESEAIIFLEQSKAYMANRDSNENIVFSYMLDNLIDQKLNENKISIRQSDSLKTISKLLSNFDFYKKEVNKITAEELQECIDSFIDYSDSYIKQIYNLINQLFEFAICNNKILINPMLKVKKVKSLKSAIKIRALTPEEQSAVVSVIAKAHLYDMPFKNIYIMMLFLGLRVHEVVALTQNDINFKKGTITINKVLTTEGKKIVVKDNYEDSRTIKINKLIMPYIEEQYNYANGNENKMLFLSKVKTLIDSHNVNNSFKKILNKLNIENVSISSLRYSYRDNCLSSGISKIDIQKNMGHIEF